MPSIWVMRVEKRDGRMGSVRFLNVVRHYRPTMLSDNLPETGAPAGFVPMPPFGPYHELVGPMYYSLRSPTGVIGLRVEEKHRNRSATPMMHGGMVATLVDTACTWAARHS